MMIARKAGGAAVAKRSAAEPPRLPPEPRLKPAAAVQAPEAALLQTAPVSTSSSELQGELTDLGSLVPERAQAYLSLLADSSTAPGAMHKHLFKMVARGAKVARIFADPLDGLVDLVSDKGRDMLLTQMGLRGGTVLAGASAEGPDGPAGVSGSGDSSSNFFLEYGSIRGSAGSFCRLGSISARGSVDDSFLPPPRSGSGSSGGGPPLSAMNAKVLSLLVSIAISGATSSLTADAGAMASAAGLLPAAATTELSHHLPWDASSLRSGFSSLGLSAPSFRGAPSLIARHTSGGDMMAPGGMAASTALRLLRADSKRMLDFVSGPSIGNLFGSVLDSVEESMDDDGRPAQQQQQADGRLARQT